MVDMRREAISRWMEDALLSELQELGVYDSSVPSQAGVLKLLIQHRIVEAAEMAMECGDFRLSSLISQASTYEGSDFRTLLVDQLSQWSENGTLEYVNEEVIMIYSLLAGSVEVLTAQKASELSWIMCLALFFWYKRGPSTSLKTALSMYQDAVAKRLANGPSSTFAYSSNKMDVLMEVMKLYVDDAGSLCSVLSPSGFAGGRDAHLDYELSWQLNSVLRALGYKIDRQWESHIHQNFIRQLEGAGLWEQAIYVSLNISDAIERTSTCRQLLLRNADMLSKAASKRVELCDRFMIPMEWIEEALAVAAVAKHDYRQEIAHWIAAQCFQEAHACLIRRVAPICLFTGEKRVLSQVLAELEPHAHEIPEWNSCGEDYLIGGGLVLEYLRLESQDALETDGEEDFLVRLLQLSDRLSHSREVSTNGTRKQKAEPSELLVARTTLSSMLVTLSTLSIQLRSALAADPTGSQDEVSEEASAPQLDPSFLSSLAAFTRGRETKFVETYRTQQLLSLCSAFVEMRA
ncbi:hypothetical protein Poli38472_014448 [Pythium oligandrum]|uniref:Nuclear pore complex protein NUP96 C-terminal domain-containing protein n=2 Tax=Pythiaceae TaxID=4782 RepID=A0A8K1CF05_PYTOL|nr:hypothetical protein Poli38472_014448 [Pythium oligandrum]|eukprot:TMW60987.1 hypothetical protein Poli38472_014448 [Pythium oligandrum]